jgi:SRSO17 transposase
LWLSTSPATTSRTDPVRHAMLRWRIGHDDQEMKQEIGLGHHEGRG